jgi:hypothetical protein
VAFRPAQKSAVAFAAGPVLAVVALKGALELAVAGRTAGTATSFTTPSPADICRAVTSSSRQ